MTNPQDPFRYSGSGDNNDNPGYQPYGNPAGYPGQPDSGYQPNPSYQPYGAGNFQGGYPSDGWGAPEKKNTLAPWALGVSIVALVLMVTLIFAPLLGLVSLILGIIAVVNARKIQGPGRRMAMSIVAIVLSLLAIIIPIVVIVFTFVFLEGTGISECFYLSDPVELEACVSENLGVDA